MGKNYQISVACDEADKILEVFKLNVRGNSEALIQRLIEQEKDNGNDITGDLEQIYLKWEDVGSEIVAEDAQESSGHMSNRDITILAESCKEFIEVILSECATWEEAETYLKGQD